MKLPKTPRPRRQKAVDYDVSVFINCPFDVPFRPLFRAMVFTIQACGFIPRCSREGGNQSDDRFPKILTLIGECRLGIHDLSRIDPGKMPRNNMPLELGAFIGCKHFGTLYDYGKDYLVLDSIAHRYKEHSTDLGGKDPCIHGDTEAGIIQCVRDWLRPHARPEVQPLIKGAPEIGFQYARFQAEAPAICYRRGLDFPTIGFDNFDEFVEVIEEWRTSGQRVLSGIEALRDRHPVDVRLPDGRPAITVAP